MAAPNVALKIIDRAIQVHGGGGVSDDFPLAMSYANLAEYLGHRYPMHRPWRGLGLVYRRHAAQHHRFFSDEAMPIDGLRVPLLHTYAYSSSKAAVIAYCESLRGEPITAGGEGVTERMLAAKSEILRRLETGFYPMRDPAGAVYRTKEEVERVASEVKVDLDHIGIIDPTKVERVALENADVDVQPRSGGELLQEAAWVSHRAAPAGRS